MSDTQIQDMDFRQLKNEVQLLRDELAITRRKYEDLLYNLDDDNFADYIKKEKENMKTEIKVSAEGIGVLVSEVYPNGVENESSIEVNAREITSKVSETDVDNKLAGYSTITQTANDITTAVTSMEGYTDGAVGDMGQSVIEQTSDKIKQTVRASYSNPVEIDNLNKRTDKTKLYYYLPGNLYYFWNGEEWESTTQANFGTVFEQTATGFKFKGNVDIDGNLITTGRISTENFVGSGNDHIQIQREFITFIDGKDNPQGENLTKMALGFIKDENGTGIPGIVFGAGDGNGNSRGYITKGTNGLDIFYITSTGGVSRLRLDDDGKLYLNDTEVPAFDPNSPIPYTYLEQGERWQKAVIGTYDEDDEEYKIDTDNVMDGAITASKIVTDGLVMRGNITWDMTNSPVKTQYSIDGITNWHADYTAGDKFLAMSFDGGTTWSSATKIVGDNGVNGTNGRDGTDANVTPQNVFNALTDGGKTQGLFNAQGDLYINATYIKTGTLNGNHVKVDNVLWLKNNAGNDVVSIFHDESNPLVPICFISTKKTDDKYTPIVLSPTNEKVYIGSKANNNEVATKGDLNNIVAKFG